MEKGPVMDWLAVYTKPRNEKKVAERLERAGVEHYLPLQTIRKQWSDRVKTVRVPVIPSYVFVRTDEASRPTILQDPGVMNFVFWMGKPAIVRDAEITRLKILLKDMQPGDTLHMEAIQPGEKVKVEFGAFRNEEGVVELDRKEEVTLVLSGAGIRLTLSKAQIAKVH